MRNCQRGAGKGPLLDPVPNYRKGARELFLLALKSSTRRNESSRSRVQGSLTAVKSGRNL
jgi:hypothetical protein